MSLPCLLFRLCATPRWAFAAISFAFACCLSLNPLGAQPTRDPIKPEFLENDRIRIGVDLGAGGGIFYFSEKSPERNLLNHYDKGRFIQQSYYGVVDGSTWSGKRWRWNPVQGGGWRDKAAKVWHFLKEGGKLYVKTLPKHWVTEEDVPEATMEEWIDLEGNMAHVHFKFAYSGTTVHPECHQEMPAVFVDHALSNLVYYTGKAPWTGAPLARRVPGGTNEGGSADESWAAYVDQSNWGIGVYFPGRTLFTCYLAKGDGKEGPKGSACSYIAPLKTFSIKPGCTHEYDFYATIGTVDSMRAAFNALHQANTSK